MPIVTSKNAEYADIPQGVRLRMIFDFAHGDAQGIALAQAEVAPGGHIFPHYHEVEEAAFISEGTAVITIDGVETAVQAGDAILVPARAIHTLKNPSPDRVTRIISAFGSSEVKRFPAGSETPAPPY
jgi:mannose-6-phosphate isomerase-like protein (cupin superfamily)